MIEPDTPGRVEIIYKAHEWDGRTMLIVIDPADLRTRNHFEWVRGEGRDEACHARSVGVHGASYHAPGGAQPARDWLLDRSYIETIRIVEPVIHRIEGVQEPIPWVPRDRDLADDGYADGL